MKRIITTTTNPGDTVLDCFGGSGTTAVACVETERRFILIEKEADYIPIIQARVGKAETVHKQRELF